MVFYFTIKEHMGLLRPEGPFFEHIENKAMSPLTLITKLLV
jgi:hypothetical protein